MIAGHRRRGRTAMFGPTVTGAGSAAAIYGCPDAGSPAAQGVDGCPATGGARGKYGSTLTVPGDESPAPAAGRRGAVASTRLSIDTLPGPAYELTDGLDADRACPCHGCPYPSDASRRACVAPFATPHATATRSKRSDNQIVRCCRNSYVRPQIATLPHDVPRPPPVRVRGDVRPISHDDVYHPSGSSWPLQWGTNARGPSAHIRRAAAPRHTACGW